MATGPDIALVSLGTTPGLVRSDASFAALVREAGASCEVVPVRLGPVANRLRRQVSVTDLVEARAARRAARGIEARAVVFSTVTAAMFQRPAIPYAVRLDAPAALNRPGPSGAWQRAVERRALGRADLLIPLSETAERALPRLDGGTPRVVRVPIPVAPVPPAPVRDIDAVTYASSPRKRGLELVCAAWGEAAPAGARLVVGGVERERALRWLDRHGVPEPPGVEWAGALPHEEWLATVARARVFVNGSRWEEYGIAALEALSAGTPLATVPTPGAFEALPLARALAPALVAPDSEPASLARALGAGLALDEQARAGYARRANEMLEPYREDAVRRTIAVSVLPALGIEPS